jgi:integrase
MPKSANFKPILQENRKHPWMLSIPANLSSTRKRQQLFFPSKKEAETAAEQFKTRKANYGTFQTPLSLGQHTEAVEAFSLIEQAKLPISLVSVVREAIERSRKRMASMSLDELFEQYLDLKQGRSAHHKKRLRSCRNRFHKAGKGKLLISDLSFEEFKSVLDKMPSPFSRNHEAGLVKSILKYAVRKKYLSENPLDPWDFFDAGNGKVTEVIRADDVEKLLNAALAHDKALLPYLVLGTYCGIRPTDELSEILWSDISFERSNVTVRKEVSKTGLRRNIPLSENALAWLKLCVPSGKYILPCTVNKMHTRRKALWEKVTSAPYPHNGMRHSFCSYWVAMHTQKEVMELLLMVGHTSPQMLWDHYYCLVEKSEAEVFWNIYP